MGRSLSLRVWVIVGWLIGGGTPSLAWSSVSVYDPSSGVLTIPSVSVGPNTYANVRLRDTGGYRFALQSADDAPPGAAAATYDVVSGIVTMPTVEVGTTKYLGVQLRHLGGYVFALEGPNLPPAVIVETRTLVFTLGNPAVGGSVVLRLEPNGRARYDDQGASGGASWFTERDALHVRYDQPQVYETLTASVDPVTGAQLRAEYRTKGFTARQVTGDWNRGTVEMTYDSEYVYTSGPQAGQPAGSVGGGYPIAVYDLARRVGVGAADVAVGARLAGLTSADIPAGPIRSGRRQDVLRIDAPGRATFEVSGTTATWALADGWIEVSAQGLPTLRYTRLDRDDSTGIEVWVAQGTIGGIPDRTIDFVGARATSGITFTAQSASRRWRAEGFYLNDPINYAGPSITLFGDGTASGLGIVRWRVDGDGSIEMVRPFLGQEYLRRWIPLQRVGPHWLVLEVVDFSWSASGTVEWRIQWQRDLGAAQ